MTFLIVFNLKNDIHSVKCISTAAYLKLNFEL